MKNVEVPQEKVKDPMAVNMKDFNLGRDPERTPMQWDTSKFGGFSDVEPWLPLEKEFKERNVAYEKQNKKSFLNLYKSVINLRKSRKSLEEGKLVCLDFKNPNILGFYRQEADEKTLILANFSKEKQIAVLPKGDWKTVLSTKLDVENRKEKDRVNLRPSEGIILYRQEEILVVT